MANAIYGAAFREDPVYRVDADPRVSHASERIVNTQGGYTEWPLRPVVRRDEALWRSRQEPGTVSVLRYREEDDESFGSQAWNQVVKPIGTGVIAPVAGAAALVGGVVYGAFSICKGVLGTVPLAIDYIVKPVVSGVGIVVGGVDDGLKWGLGLEHNGHQAGSGHYYVEQPYAQPEDKLPARRMLADSRPGQAASIEREAAQNRVQAERILSPPNSLLPASQFGSTDSVLAPGISYAAPIDNRQFSTMPQSFNGLGYPAPVVESRQGGVFIEHIQPKIASFPSSCGSVRTF